MAKSDTPLQKETTPEKETKKLKCGIIMPISSMDGYSAEHWLMVKKILEESIQSLGLESDLVSDTDEVSVIQKTIVQNIYNNDIIVCDVSGRNANVMFELGMRLTFDKLAVIVKDDVTPSPFDTSIIEYIPYRKDLRYYDIQIFKEKLASKIQATLKKKDDAEYSPFIKHFGPFTVPKIEQTQVEPINYILERLDQLSAQIHQQNQPFSINTLKTQNTNLKRTKEFVFEELQKFMEPREFWIKEHNNPNSALFHLLSDFLKDVPMAVQFEQEVKNAMIIYFRIFGVEMNPTIAKGNELI